jgi:uncharacterized membrane protein YjgN (DUF898 family)
MSDVAQKQTPIIFTGKFSEYFGIWIVNLLLSILTLGVYSAWAKVRRKKYFYHNTLIDGVSFDYHGKPLSILKGRAIALAMFVSYLLTQDSYPLFAQILVIAFFIILPWLVVKGALFKARNASYRGIRFDFVGSVKEAARVFILMPLLTLFTAGLCTPLASQQKNQFLVDNVRFGKAAFDMQATIKSFYMVYIKFFIKLILLVIMGMFLLGFLVGGIMKGQSLLFERSAQQVKPAQFYSQMVSAPLRAVTPQAANQQTANQAVRKKGDELGRVMHQLAFKVMRLAASGLVFLMIAAYLQARIGNLVWNSTRLDQLSFNCTMRARDFIWIYFSNLFCIICTFGLATPWAQIRMARYRTSKLQIVGDIDFDQFVGDKQTEVAAMGDEMADVFDVDLSFG